MWEYQHSVETSAAGEAVFAIFRDVTTWKEWNAGVERVELAGPFAKGTTGTMVVPGQDPLAFRLVWVDDARGFEDETQIPDAEVVVRVRHLLETLKSGRTRITYVAQIDGPGAATAGPSIGPAITADFPEVMAALVARAEAESALG